MRDMDMASLCQIGAEEQRRKLSRGNWHVMATAPRDGTPIELKCTYGVGPWYGLFFWTDEQRYMNSSRVDKGEWHWGRCNGDSDSPFDEGSLLWRPYHGDPAAYVDPTHGAQDTNEYWRGAVAAEYGLNPHCFEKDARPWWKRLFQYLASQPHEDR